MLSYTLTRMGLSARSTTRSCLLGSVSMGTLAHTGWSFKFVPSALRQSMPVVCLAGSLRKGDLACANAPKEVLENCPGGKHHSLPSPRRRRYRQPDMNLKGGCVGTELTSSARYLRVMGANLGKALYPTSGHSSTIASSPISAIRGRGRGRVPDSGHVTPDKLGTGTDAPSPSPDKSGTGTGTTICPGTGTSPDKSGTGAGTGAGVSAPCLAP
jgi:hypothetical protein